MPNENIISNIVKSGVTYEVHDERVDTLEGFKKVFIPYNTGSGTLSAEDLAKLGPDSIICAVNGNNEVVQSFHYEHGPNTDVMSNYFVYIDKPNGVGEVGSTEWNYAKPYTEYSMISVAASNGQYTKSTNQRFISSIVGADVEDNTLTLKQLDANGTITDIEFTAQGGGSEYSAGEGIDITDNTISVSDDYVEAKATVEAVIFSDIPTIEKSFFTKDTSEVTPVIRTSTYTTLRVVNDTNDGKIFDVEEEDSTWIRDVINEYQDNQNPSANVTFEIIGDLYDGDGNLYNYEVNASISSIKAYSNSYILFSTVDSQSQPLEGISVVIRKIDPDTEEELDTWCYGDADEENHAPITVNIRWNDLVENITITSTNVTGDTHNLPTFTSAAFGVINFYVAIDGEKTYEIGNDKINIFKNYPTEDGFYGLKVRVTDGYPEFMWVTEEEPQPHEEYEWIDGYKYYTPEDGVYDYIAGFSSDVTAFAPNYELTSVISIEEKPYTNSITSFDFDGCTQIYDYAFLNECSNCEVIEIPDSVEYVGDNAFTCDDKSSYQGGQGQATELTIGANADCPFGGPFGHRFLTSCTVDSNNTHFSYTDGCLCHIENGQVNKLLNCCNSVSTINIPETDANDDAIRYLAYNVGSVETINIPDSVYDSYDSSVISELETAGITVNRVTE